MLSGVSEDVWKQLERTEAFATIPEEDIFIIEETLVGSTIRAMEAANSWLNQSPEIQQGQ